MAKNKELGGICKQMCLWVTVKLRRNFQNTSTVKAQQEEIPSKGTEREVIQ